MMWDIYGNATGVCIWLGEANDASRIALKFINEEVLKLRDFDELCDRPDASKKWRSLLELMQRPWFSRRWVCTFIKRNQNTQDLLVEYIASHCHFDALPYSHKLTVRYRWYKR